MVGAGEVDEDLEVETKEECEKYGKVGKCVIFEVRENLSFVLATPKVNWPFVFHVWHTTAVKEQHRLEDFKGSFVVLRFYVSNICKAQTLNVRNSKILECCVFGTFFSSSC